ncbi:MAG: amino acid permease [Acidobacteria bacterium]|nr:amino acid permease [Acidobacteriota bacterium]MCA1637857.1 amino acid permease [Acidobacteriota bacterium]
MESVPIIAESPTLQKNKLLKILGIGFGLAIVISGMIGTGIFRTPGIVAANLGNAWLIIVVWILGGIYALVGANTFSELATTLPEAGGPYVYIRRAFGDFFGFAGGMNDFIQNCCANAFLAIAFGEYLGALAPSFAGRENFIAVAVLLLLFLINWIGLKAGDFTVKLLSFIKVVALFILIAACFIFGGNKTGASESTAAFSGSLAVFAAVALALQSVFVTYNGWNMATYFAEENTDPARAIPRSMFGGVLIVMTIYVLINAALLYVLPIAEIAASKLPAADTAVSVFGDAGGKIITAIALVSILGILNGQLLFQPRILFSMSRDGLLPSVGAKVNAGGTPIVALLIVLVLSIGFALSGTFETLLAIAAFLSLATDTACYLALFILRRREPDLPRSYRAVGYPALPAIVLIGAWILLIVYVVGDTMNSLYSIGILLLLYPAFLIVRRLLKN